MLAGLVKIVIDDPEIAFLDKIDYNQEHFDLNKKVCLVLLKRTIINFNFNIKFKKDGRFHK